MINYRRVIMVFGGWRPEKADNEDFR